MDISFETVHAEFVKTGDISGRDLRCRKGFGYKVSPTARRVEEVIHGRGIGVRRSFDTLQADQQHREMQVALARSEALQQGIRVRQIVNDWHQLPGTKALLKLMAKEANRRFHLAKIKRQCNNGSIIQEIRIQQRNIREVADEDNSRTRLRILEEVVSSFAFPGTTVNIPGSEYLALLDEYHVVNCQVHVNWTPQALDQFIQQYPPSDTLTPLIVSDVRRFAPCGDSPHAGLVLRQPK